MSSFAKFLYAALAAALMMPVIVLSPANAFSAPGRRAASADTPSHIVRVHSRAHDGDHHRHYGRHHRHHRHTVDAPFTRVETGRTRAGHRVVVDAPFAHVTVGRRGRHVRAPFVDLWLPR